MGFARAQPILRAFSDVGPGNERGALMTTINHVSSSSARGGMTGDEKFVIFASSIGTVFEWYDFFLYAVLAPFFASLFFPAGKKIILAGCVIAALTYFPLFAALTHYANPDLEAFSDRNSVTVTADGSTCELHVFVTAFTRFSNCDRAQDLVTKLGVSFKTESVPNSGDKVNLTIGATTIEGFDAGKWNAAFLDSGYPNLQRDKDGKIVPKPADTANINWSMTELILVIMVIYVTMVYGPIAAFLVELFPTRIRYTSMSLPYHIGAGFFGGMLPLLATAIVAATGNIYNGLWYPIVVAVMTAIIGGLLLHDTKDVDIKVGSGVEAAQRA
jgi:hypothetical protein